MPNDTPCLNLVEPDDRLKLLKHMTIADRRKFLQNRYLDGLYSLRSNLRKIHGTCYRAFQAQIDYLLMLIRPEVNRNLSLRTDTEIHEYILVTARLITSWMYVVNPSNKDLYDDTNLFVIKAFRAYENLRDMTPEFCASFMSAKDISVASLVQFMKNDACHKYDSVIMKVLGGS